MSDIKVTEIVVHSNLEPTAEEREGGIVYTSELGSLFDQELVDEAIEDHEKRSKLTPSAGNISITVVPGTELGNVSINVQFEGKQGLYDHCLQNQGELFEAAAGWLGEILADLGADFNVRIEARPCQKTDKRLPLKHAADILAGVSGKVQQRANVEARVENKTGHKVR